jgi:hypothetical protein
MPNPQFSFTLTSVKIAAPSPDSGIAPMIGWTNAGWFVGLMVNNGSPLSYALPNGSPGNTLITTQKSSYGVYYSVDATTNKANLLAYDPVKAPIPVSICSQSFSPGNYSLTLTINADGSLSVTQA